MRLWDDTWSSNLRLMFYLTCPSPVVIQMHSGSGGLWWFHIVGGSFYIWLSDYLYFINWSSFYCIMVTTWDRPYSGWGSLLWDYSFFSQYTHTHTPQGPSKQVCRVWIFDYRQLGQEQSLTMGYLESLSGELKVRIWRQPCSLLKERLEN